MSLHPSKSESVAQLLDGRASAEQLETRIAAACLGLSPTPRLDVILVGDDPASMLYVRNKQRRAKKVGILSRLHHLERKVSAAQLDSLIDALNNDSTVHGILLQLPLPAHLDTEALLERIAAAKDVDGLHPENRLRLATAKPHIQPCTPQGCLLLITQFKRCIEGSHAVVIGRSRIVGKPLATLLLAADCTVTTAHSKSHDLPQIARQADILVSAIGRPETVRGSWIKPGAIVIDVGINRQPGSRQLLGDVCFAEARRRAAAITPVPGGVGPMTIACLLVNTVRAYSHQETACTTDFQRILSLS